MQVVPRAKRQIQPALSVTLRAGFLYVRNCSSMAAAKRVTGPRRGEIYRALQPLLPYLRGQSVPPSSRLTAIQCYLRTDDADMVGTNGRKATNFYMLGNWSIGDYGKCEAINMALELLTTFQLDLSKLWVTVFAGDELVLALRDRHVCHCTKRLVEQVSGLVEIGLVDNQRRQHPQRVGTRAIEQQSVFKSLLHNHRSQIVLDIDRTHQAKSTWAIDKVIFRAQRIQLAKPVLAHLRCIV